jgi:hypothetical protein
VQIIKNQGDAVEKKFRRRMFILLFVLSIILFQLGASLFQDSRYHFNEEGYEDYCCVQMSRDCEEFFEGLGIRVYQISGSRETEELTDEGNYKTVWHRWILLDFGWIRIPYESTRLCPCNPLWSKYTTVFISDGFILDGKDLYNETELKRYRVWDGYTTIFYSSDGHIINDEHFDEETGLRNIWWEYE